MITVDDLVPLARGGTAELFAGRAGGDRVVVKLARDDRAGAAAALAAEAEILEVLARVDPGLAPRLVGRIRLRGRDALVLEHLARLTLRAAKASGLAAAAAVAAAVARIHAAGVVHGDLTPDNLLIDDAGVRPIDFGTAAVIGGALAPLATVGYAAPERQVAGCAADPAVDVYALGVLCFELITGAAPFAGAVGERRVAHAAHRVPWLRERVAVPAELDALVAAAMAKAPAERPTAAALAAALAAATAGAPTLTTAGDPTPATAGAPVSAADDPIAATAGALIPAPAGDLAAAVGAPAPARPAPGAQPAVLVGFAWSVGAARLRDQVAAEGGVLAASEADRHVAAIWRGDAHAAAARLADGLRAAGATGVDVVEARVQIGATGVPRGAAILALVRARPAPPPAPPALGTRPDASPRGSRAGSCEAPAPPSLRAPRHATTPAAPDDDGAPAERAPLVGREAALAAIAAAAEAARAGSALVTVWGAPGLGKSRLAAAARDQLRAAGFEMLEVRAPDVAGLLGALPEAAPGGAAPDVQADAAVDRAALAALAGRAALAGSPAEPLAAAPGALRQAAARALARRLAGAVPRAILVDDAHAADPIVLDALELATLEPRGQLLVLALARPPLAATRPRWSRRAARAETVTLAPLDRDAGRALIRALLPAVAAVPSAALDRLVERCGGVPLYLSELVRALQRADRARGATTTATRGALPTDLVELPAELGIVAWAVADELAGVSPGAVAAAEAIAIGGELARPDAAALFAALGIALDPGVAIAELRATGALVADARALRFRHDLVREAIAARVAPARRPQLHRAWLAFARDPADRARHAEGAGERAAAAAAWQDVARAAAARHDELAVDHALSRALACLDAPPAELLRQRGGARARLGRHDAAAADFAAARERARAAGDRAGELDVLLDEATALDWALHHAASAARVAAAAALATADEPPLRRARLAMAAGRTAWRAGDAAAAIAPCRQAIALADPLGAAGYETAIACRLMLGFVLGARGDHAAAAAILDEAEAQAAARGDQLHVAAARCNRYPVHAARGDAAALRADLAGFATAGRELGIAVTEYRGALYLALVALWCGDDAAALDHARAARRVEAADPALCPRPCAALVLAELAARRGDRADALAWCEVADHHAALAPAPATASAAVDRVTRAAIAAWARGDLTAAAASALADQAIALGEAEAAFQILELAARTASDPAAAAAAHRAARAVPGLPRFIPGLENALP